MRITDWMEHVLLLVLYLGMVCPQIHGEYQDQSKGANTTSDMDNSSVISDKLYPTNTTDNASDSGGLDHIPVPFFPSSGESNSSAATLFNTHTFSTTGVTTETSTPSTTSTTTSTSTTTMPTTTSKPTTTTSKTTTTTSKPTTTKPTTSSSTTTTRPTTPTTSTAATSPLAPNTTHTITTPSFTSADPTTQDDIDTTEASSTDMTTTSVIPNTTYSEKSTEAVSDSTELPTSTVSMTELSVTQSRVDELTNQTEAYDNSTLPHHNVAYSLLDFDSSDSFWPVAMALTIGIPAIIVFGVTIAVLYKRRTAKPRSLLAMYGQDM